MKNKISIYLGNEIAFQNGDSIMVNATQMAKPFSKRVAKWLELPSTASFLASLASIRKSDTSEYQAVRSIMGSPENGGGTWMHEDVALEFARWLSPEFGIWCNDRIKELMQYGMTATPETLEEMLANPDLVIGLATQLKESREENAKLKPKAEFADKVFEAPNTFSVSTAAKMLGTGQRRLFAMLRDRKILLPDNTPYQTFVERGYFKPKGTKVGSPAYPKVVSQTMVTTKGLAWIRINIVEPKNQ